ncbi:MAG: exosome complex exonuclease Rrp41 [Candidatus Diapherotrites archaeon]|nr:exosome complex exonuclease Rrp41 [Candidatus Diapherotrites archaeon]
MDEKTAYVDKHGKRTDGRVLNEVRPIKIEVGVIPEADGSCYLEWGQNKVFAAVYGPNECIPKHMSDPTKAIIRYNYRMASFSVPDRKRPQPGRREVEISKVSGEAFEKVVFLERFPGTQIEVEVEILDSNAGTRVAALTAASVAMADAGIPMKDIIVGCGVGKAGGHVMVDLNKFEEDAPDAVDVPMAILPSTDEIVLLQLDGLATREEFQSMISEGIKACKMVYEKQKEALKQKYRIPAEESMNLPEQGEGFE